MADAMDLTVDGVDKPGYTLVHQVIELDVDFSEQIRGRTEITLYPDSKDLRDITISSKQCRIGSVLVNDQKPLHWDLHEPCDRLRVHAQGAGIHQHHILDSKLGDGLGSDAELSITLPIDVKIEEVNLTEIHTQSLGTITLSGTDGVDPTETTQTLSDTSVAKYTPLKVSIEFVSHHLRDGLQFVLGKPGNGRWPHAYTRSSPSSGTASCIIPCIDSLTARCTWDITIRCPKTVRDAFRQAIPTVSLEGTSFNGEASDIMDREMLVICSGDMTDDVVRKENPDQKIVSFSCSQQLSARQIGFAIGPFERVSLSALRDAQDEEELGQNAVELLGYCLPGRSEEMRNTTLATAYAMDSVVNKYLSYPFGSYSVIFVEDAPTETAIFAGLTLCSTRMLYPNDVIDPAQDVTRKLVHSITSQWFGMSIIAQDPGDTWVILAISYYMADAFMKDLCGNNEFRFRMRQMSDRVAELDHDRPSIYDIGTILHVDSSEYEFLSLKAPVVLFILDRRIAKVAGTSKMTGIISKILTKARIGDLSGNLLSTEIFQRTCERFYHAKIDDFVNQWVKGAGCPAFQMVAAFNKKKLVIEMNIKQVQVTKSAERHERDLDERMFMRDFREDHWEVYAAGVQPTFTGSMTIRIHESDGTPYEHIVEIKDTNNNYEIPYNAKYKRMKRSKKQKAKTTAELADGDNDALFYSLGDILSTDEELRDWKLVDWNDVEDATPRESPYEWIRADADFEWIGHIATQVHGWQATSMVQQDRDVVAQFEGLRQLAALESDRVIASVFLRTMVDDRYFHGIRSRAAAALVKQAQKGETHNPEGLGLFHLKKAFEELYCSKEHGSVLTRPNDFSNVKSYFLQGAIVVALSQIRDENGFAPLEVKEFLLDKLKFNDNSSNRYSDAFYVSRLMEALCSAVLARSTRPVDPDSMDIDVLENEQAHRRIEQEFINEVDRYRRMDEWTGSFQNLYSRTALDCQQMLREGGIGQNSVLQFLQYTRPGNYDELRLKAYEILIRPSLFDDKSVLKYVLHSMVADTSPFLRQGISDAFGRALASRAIGSAEEALTVVGQDDALAVDNDAVESRKKRLARRKSMDGATLALREELGNNETLQDFLWKAISYSDIGERDLRPLLDFCRLLYEPVDSLKMSLNYPRYWGCERLAKVSSYTAVRRSTNANLFPSPRNFVSTGQKKSAQRRCRNGSQHHPLLHQHQLQIPQNR